MPKKYSKRADGYYSTRVYLGTVDGKKKYKQIYGKTTKEVAQKEAEVRRQLNVGLDLLSNDSFGFWCERWLSFQKKELTEERYGNYRVKLELIRRYSPQFDILQGSCPKCLPGHPWQ